MEWLTKAWDFVKTHKKKVGATLAGLIAAFEYLGWGTGLLTKLLSYLGGAGG